jgi:hypothetical protein
VQSHSRFKHIALFLRLRCCFCLWVETLGLSMGCGIRYARMRPTLCDRQVTNLPHHGGRVVETLSLPTNQTGAVFRTQAVARTDERRQTKGSVLFGALFARRTRSRPMPSETLTRAISYNRTRKYLSSIGRLSIGDTIPGWRGRRISIDGWGTRDNSGSSCPYSLFFVSGILRLLVGRGSVRQMLPTLVHDGWTASIRRSLWDSRLRILGDREWRDCGIAG